MEEDNIAGEYRLSLGALGDIELIQRLEALLLSTGNDLEAIDRSRLRTMIMDIDYTGEYDAGFEDERAKLTSNSHCG